MTTFFSKKNNAKTTLDGAINGSVTTINVIDGSVFPSSGSFICTLWKLSEFADPSDDSQMEILKVTSRTGNVLTVVRGQENTSGVSHINGDACQHLFTAAQIVELETAVNLRIELSKYKRGVQPNEAPNGSRVLFTLPTSYLADSLAVYVFGQRVFSFGQTNPAAGTFTFESGFSAPDSGEPIYADYIEGS